MKNDIYNSTIVLSLMTKIKRGKGLLWSSVHDIAWKHAERYIQSLHPTPLKLNIYRFIVLSIIIKSLQM